MRINARKVKNAIVIFAVGMAMASCQKLVHPALDPNYPKDANPPGGPLKFFAAMDGTDVDSTRANFGVDNNVSYVDGGVSGKALQFDGSKNGYVAYPTANDFSGATNFTIAFWMKISLAQKDHNNADAILAFASTSNFWSNAVVFADHESSTSDSMQLKFHFANGGGDNWDFAGYAGNARWPKMYDGVWHHVAFVYDATAKTATLYRDGVQFDKKTSETIAFQDPSQLILGGFQQAQGIQGDYAGNTWMSGFPGMMDNVRLYGEALSASDVQALYTNKQ